MPSELSWGNLFPNQEKALRPYVVNSEVTDLGAGDLHLSRHIRALGARKVIAVDWKGLEPHEDAGQLETEGIHFIRAAYEKYEAPVDVAFVSWPMTWGIQGLVEVLRRARLVIYLGKNTDRRICGTPELFRYLLTRELVKYVPHRENVLTIYGATLESPRTPHGEEEPALMGISRPYAAVHGRNKSA